jgi:hypothetical protein
MEFCCSHVELEYFEVYFFLQNIGVFDITYHSISTLEILESQDLSYGFIWRKEPMSFCLIQYVFRPWNGLFLSVL